MLHALADPLREFTVVPQWFWNDVLTEDELVRQIDDFQAHGVYGFMIHPRVGLPRDIGWMSDRFLHFMHVAIEEARRRDLLVYLYDEGMYPSGASSGQVVAADPALQSRGLDYRGADRRRGAGPGAGAPPGGDRRTRQRHAPGVLRPPDPLPYPRPALHRSGRGYPRRG